MCYGNAMADNRTVKSLPASALVQALPVTVVWGFIFVVMKVGGADVPPLMRSAPRFTFCMFPTIFLVRKPSNSSLRSPSPDFHAKTTL